GRGPSFARWATGLGSGVSLSRARLLERGRLSGARHQSPGRTSRWVLGGAPRAHDVPPTLGEVPAGPTRQVCSLTCLGVGTFRPAPGAARLGPLSRARPHLPAARTNSC